MTPFLIGDARFRRLLDECGGDAARADELFVWNVRAAGAALEAIYVFELILRNTMDQALRAWNDAINGTPDWTFDPHPYLLKSLKPDELTKSVLRARSIARDHGRSAVHDDVVAQLSLGTWRYLLPSRASKPKQKLWEVALRSAFPAWAGDWDPESLVNRVANAHGLRNRVAHLEPLHRLDLRRVRRDMRSVCHAVGPEAARVFVQTERLLSVIEENPAAQA